MRELGKGRHRLLAETRPRMAKVSLPDVRKPEADTWRADIGRTVQRAISLLGWSLKEFAGAVGRDERQCARWIAGIERPQLDVIFAVPPLRRVWVIAIAEIVGEDVEIETTIRVRRRA